MLSHLLPFKWGHWFVAVVLAGDLVVGKALVDSARELYGIAAAERLTHWQNLMTYSRKLPEPRKLVEVNDFFNRMRFVHDIDHWGEEDFWATPVELLASGAGDCEDFSIAKYFTLRELGVADEKLRITYVKAVELDQAHMVLSYFAGPGEEPLILDNLVSEIRPASHRTDLVPVYNFNGDGLWLSRQRGEGVRIGESSKIKTWTELRRRLQKSNSQGRLNDGSS
ncbi:MULTISPECIES: transglutaminase-like cysteine peptidase [Gammaproteobacteria]|uniref:transglutaminase-like cysteine peptidase n=1 Tax=Gammaproteobacteria TaxID=1236 RepID=UPI001ADC00D0|nr:MULTISPECIES: transglutaminase-like cysteine peptidase [Gammaproteobacteria]MBO9482811.1 transglutaminase-like cysteine peptidase [Salinisphaera sp. G21_0]MBO9495175.1 transglutaminase-like cysteine peptidase [Thalassotalea sp. G20_0]